MTIFEKIQTLCQCSNITIAQLERELGLSNGIIRAWGTKSDPSFSKIKKVADYFNVSCESLYTDDEQEEDNKFYSSPELDCAINLRITQIRSKESVNQADFANKLGVSIDTVRCIDQNRRPPTNDLIRRVCNAYNINERWLRDGVGDMIDVSGKLFDDERTMLSIFRSLPAEIRRCALAQINELLKLCVEAE